MQFFSRRKPKSTWSKINKQKITALAEAGLMTPAGLDYITVAKQNDSWEILDQVEEPIMPDDLEFAFEGQPEAKVFFLRLRRSVKKSLLQWVVLAKR